MQHTAGLLSPAHSLRPDLQNRFSFIGSAAVSWCPLLPSITALPCSVYHRHHWFLCLVSLALGPNKLLSCPLPSLRQQRAAAAHPASVSEPAWLAGSQWQRSCCWQASWQVGCAVVGLCCASGSRAGCSAGCLPVCRRHGAVSRAAEHPAGAWSPHHGHLLP